MRVQNVVLSNARDARLPTRNSHERLVRQFFTGEFSSHQISFVSIFLSVSTPSVSIYNLFIFFYLKFNRLVLVKKIINIIKF